MTLLSCLRLLPAVALFAFTATGCASSQCRVCHHQATPCPCSSAAVPTPAAPATPAAPMHELPAPSDSTALQPPSSPYGESMRGMVRIESPDPSWHNDHPEHSTPINSTSQRHDQQAKGFAAETAAAERELKPITESASTIPANGPSATPPRRRVFADITAHPAFAHAPDYSWLVGQLAYSHTRRTWSVRYASVDETDRYGGSVTLDSGTNLQQLQEGMLVRVQGRLLDPDTTTPAPRYRVERIEPFHGQ